MRDGEDVGEGEAQRAARRRQKRGRQRRRAGLRHQISRVLTGLAGGQPGNVHKAYGISSDLIETSGFPFPGMILRK